MANMPGLTSLNIDECEVVMEVGLAALPDRVKVKVAGRPGGHR
jgi:hypothetical protein